MQAEFQQAIYLALGSNFGNRAEHLREAVAELSKFFQIKQLSHIIETEALLLENSPASWNIPYLNMIVSGKTSYSPSELLAEIKRIEKKLGRDLNAPRWSPRAIDIDIISYYGQEICENELTIPHKEIKNRAFWQYLLAELGYEISDAMKNAVNSYSALNHFVLYPRFVGVVNVTPDSFSDGGKFLQPEKAEEQIRKLVSDGAAMVDIGAQSTRPGYVEASPQEEISRLGEVLERCKDIDCISIDTYFDEVIEYTIKKHPNIKCINVQQLNRLEEATLNLIADRNLKIIVMLNGRDLYWFEYAVSTLEKHGIRRSNIIIDPGIGFGKTKLQNIEAIKNFRDLRRFECDIMLAHSRKSFISLFSNSNVENRDIETIVFSAFTANTARVDYIRVHNVKDHMRFFVANNTAAEGIINEYIKF